MPMGIIMAAVAVFEIQSEMQISATLGDEQLRMGIIAGLIGLALVAAFVRVEHLHVRQHVFLLEDVLDRAKDVGRLKDGSLFPPKYVENKLKFYPNIKEVVAFGAGRDYVACFINIDLTAVGSWAERNSVVYGSVPRCKTVNGSTECLTVYWPVVLAYGKRSSHTWAQYSYNGWFGSLVQDQTDGTGQMYRRNRYYDHRRASSPNRTRSSSRTASTRMVREGAPVTYGDPHGLCAFEIGRKNSRRTACYAQEK